MSVLKNILLILVVANVITESKLSLLHSFNLDIILRGLRNFNSTTSCGLHLKEYFTGLLSDESWAQTMRDSSAHTLHGVYNGNNKFIGHFDECLSAEHPKFLFQGKHCVLNLGLLDEELRSLIPVEHRRFEGFIKQSTQFEAFPGYFSALFAICIPSTCSAKEIEETLKNWFSEQKEEAGSVRIRLVEDNCYSKEDISKKMSNRLIVYFFLGICVLSLSSTIYDVVQRWYYNVDQPHNLLISFSVYTNSSYLIRDDRDEHILKTLNGLRAMYVLFVLFAHVHSGLWLGLAENLKDFEKELNQYGYVNANHFTDVFFFIGGFILAYNFSRRLTEKGFYDFPLFLIDRYLRISPTLVVIRLFSGWLYLNLASGPIWNYFNKADFEACQDGWITSLLYAWNYVDPMQSCMRQGWYLNIDMQLFWLSPLIFIPVLYYPTWRNFYYSILISIATCISFAVWYSHGFRPHARHFPEIWASEYIVTHARAAPWLIGVFFGHNFYSIYDKKIKIKLSKLKKLLGWTMSLVCFSISTIGGYLLDDEYVSSFQGALYISLSKVLSTLSIAWVIFACQNGFGGPIAAFLSSRFLQFLAKLSFTIYMVQLMIISYIVGTQKANYIFGSTELINYIPTALSLIVIVAVGVTIVIEIPCNNIRRYFLYNAKIWPIYAPVKKE